MLQLERKIYVCFVDFQKAFDSVWHKGLFHKLKKAGINGNTLTLIEDSYKKTKTYGVQRVSE